MIEPIFNRVLQGLQEALNHTQAKSAVDFREKIDTPDTIDKQNENPEDEPMKHKAKKELITRQVEDTNLATKKDKAHYLNELEVGWRKMKAKAVESPDDIVEDSIGMAMSNIKSLTMHLQSLIVMVQAGNQECLAEPWVQEKLTLSRDYIMAVHDYISSEQEGEDGEDGEDDEEEDDAEEENNYYGQSSK
jgi:hypothetical protein